MKKAGPDKNNPRSFEDILRQKLEETDSRPRNNAWSRLEQSLDQELVHKPARKRYLFLLLLIGTLTGVFSYYYFFAIKPDPNKTELVTDSISANTEVKNSIAEQEGAKNIASATKTKTEASIKTWEEKTENNSSETTSTNLSKETSGVKPESDSSISPSASTKTENQRDHKKLTAPSQTPVKETGKITGSAQAGKKPQRPKAELSGSDTIKNEPGRVSEKTQDLDKHESRISTKDKGKLNPVFQDSAFVNSPFQRPENKSFTLADMADTATFAQADSALIKVKEPIENALHAADSLSTPGIEQNKRRKIFSLTVFGGPSYFNQNIKLKERPGGIVQHQLTIFNQDPLYAKAAENFDNNTVSALSYHFGLGVSKEIYKAISIETGICYSYLAATTTSDFAVADTVNLGGGIQYKNVRPLLVGALSSAESIRNSVIISTATHSVNYNYSYLHFPLKLKGNIAIGRWLYFASGGIEMSRLLQSKITHDNLAIQTEAAEPYQQQFFRPWLWSGLFSAGLGYQLTDKILINANGNIRAALSPITKEKTVQGVQQNGPRVYNLSIGITYSFLRQ